MPYLFMQLSSIWLSNATIELCVNRFDDDTKASFLDLYTKVDAGEDVSNYGQEEIEEESNDSEEEVDNNQF